MRHHLQCAVCAKAFWTYRATQRTCSLSCAGRLRTAPATALDAGRYTGAQEARTDGAPYAESVDAVESLWLAARAARLARERATGQREHTIGGDVTYVRQDGRVCVERAGWVQRAGRSCMDGEMRLTEMAEGV